jgi:flagellin-like protein
MKKSWVIRKAEEGVSPVIATILMVAMAVVLAAILYVMTISLATGPGASPPVIGMNRESNIDNYIWTIVAIEGGRTVLKTDVFVQLHNESSFNVLTEPLLDVSGTHGFNYFSATTGDSLGAGDVFTLSKDYGPGTVLTLVNLGATGQYALLAV